MQKHTSQITTKSVEQSGLPTDYKKAIAEYIWNGFDAGAKNVHLDFKSDEIGYISSFSITDDGAGIDMQTISETFGHFLDSHKTAYINKKNFIKGRKGKGRYAFHSFANSCSWLTTFIGPEGDFLRYNIIINKGDLENYRTEDTVIAKDKKTGTVVSFSNIFALTGDLLLKKDFTDYLASEFGWYLFLNSENGCKIFINGVELSYTDMVGYHEAYEHTIGNEIFKIDFIRWNQKIGDKYYFYFLKDNQKEAAKKHTSFNNKAIEFHHSLYVKSSYFNDFQETVDEAPVLEFSGKNQTSLTFKHLVKDLTDIVAAQEKEFIREIAADKLIKGYETNGVFPFVAETEEQLLHLQSLKDVIREVYSLEPKLFHDLNNQQSKFIIGLLDIALLTNQGSKVLNLLKGIINLTEEELNNLSAVL